MKKKKLYVTEEEQGDHFLFGTACNVCVRSCFSQENWSIGL